MSTQNTSRSSYITIALLFMAVCMLLASWYIKEKQEDYRSTIVVKLTEQETKLTSFAELIDRDGADFVVNQIVKDCPLEERQRFDQLLGLLSQLKQAELQEVDLLFDACGSFYADRQGILVIRFDRELEIYQEYLSLLELTGTDTKKFSKQLERWVSLLEIEKQRTQRTTELVDIQKNIIELLVSGEKIQSESINGNLQQAQSAKDSLSLLNVQADNLRSELSSI